MTKFLQAAVVSIAVLGTGAVAVSALNSDVPDFPVPDAAWEAGSQLDGRVFSVTGSVVETGSVLDPTDLSFRDGGFKSSRCQTYCEFGYQPYRTWTDGEATYFTATTTCPDAPHTVVWYGKVTGDTMQVEGSWTTRRWYWTRQMNLIGEGMPASGAVSG